MTTREEGAVPDFLRMDEAIGSDMANAGLNGDWYGWPSKEVNPVTLLDDEGRTVRIRTPVMDLEGADHAHPSALHRAAFRRPSPDSCRSVDVDHRRRGQEPANAVLG